MPIYDYSCANCGHVVEVVHGVHEAGPTVCPNCGGLLRKRLSPPAIVFRGTGWAKKDARAAMASRTKGGPGSGDKERGGGTGDSTEKSSAGDASKAEGGSKGSSSSTTSSAD
jgi:putative FmdB family regulatory protein